MRRVLIALICALAAGCATPMAAQQPTLQNVQALRAQGMPSLALGDFALAPGLPAGMDRSIGIRASSLHAPGDGSFSHYLRSTMETNLTAAGKLDPASATVVSALLTQSEVSTELGDSHGALAARFKVMRNGATLFEREESVEDRWASSFIGAVAIPTAMDRYSALYPSLVQKLLNDPDFQAAVRAP